MNSLSLPAESRHRFRHEALLYAGQDEFIEATSRFILGGVEAGEPTLVVVARQRIDALRDTLGAAGENVLYADMADVGANPGHIIPAWRAFVDGRTAGGRRVRGIGEPVWAGRGDAELVECQRHEVLLNVVFAGASTFWLLCPYDSSTLDQAVLEEAHRSHPFVSDAAGGAWRTVARAANATAARVSLDAPLAAAPAGARELPFTAWSLAAVRSLAGREAARAGLRSCRIADLVLAVNELATNSVRHGGGSGKLRVWRDGGAVVCEVRDAGRVTSPLVDRQRPGAEPRDPRGLWLANHLCDLVQLRSSDSGTTVRLHMAGV